MSNRAHRLHLYLVYCVPNILEKSVANFCGRAVATGQIHSLQGSSDVAIPRYSMVAPNEVSCGHKASLSLLVAATIAKNALLEWTAFC